MGARGHRWMGLACLVVLAACGSSSPSSPTAAPSGSGVPELRINGLPSGLGSGATAQLIAEIVLPAAVKVCAAAWSVDAPNVAGISSSGLLTAKTTGYVTIKASCDGLTAGAETRIDGPDPYRLIIVAYDREVPNEFGVQATMEFLDGPRAGQRVPTGTVFQDGLFDVQWPVKVRFTASDYESKDFVLAESTGTRRNPTSPLFDFRVPMTFVPDALTDTYVRTMSKAEMEIAHPFAMRVPGPVQIRTWWSVDYNDMLFVELWCGGQMLRSTSQLFGSAGAGFTHDVPAPGACQLRLRQSKSDAATHYRVAIRYPR